MNIRTGYFFMKTSNFLKFSVQDRNLSSKKLNEDRTIRWEDQINYLVVENWIVQKYVKKWQSCCKQNGVGHCVSWQGQE